MLLSGGPATAAAEPLLLLLLLLLKPLLLLLMLLLLPVSSGTVTREKLTVTYQAVVFMVKTTDHKTTNSNYFNHSVPSNNANL